MAGVFYLSKQSVEKEKVGLSIKLSDKTSFSNFVLVIIYRMEYNYYSKVLPLR